jgi:hypothetical protein
MLHLGRLGQIYVVKEGAYGTHPGHASADALRHINFGYGYDSTVNSPEKKQSPGRAVRFARRETANLAVLEALVRPSGTIAIAPEADEVFEAAFGAKTNPALTTTMTAGATLGGGTLTSGAGLAFGDAILITCPDGIKRMRFLTAINTGTGVATWLPTLPAGQIPAAAAAVKSAITYKLTSALAISLAISHYLKKTDLSAGFKRGGLGVGIDKLVLMFDANEEARFQASGPAKTQTTNTTPAPPAAFTTVGGNPPSGLTSDLLIGNTAAKFLKLQLELTNGLRVRNNENGTASAQELYRGGFRDLVCGIDMRVEDETLIYDAAEAGTNLGVMLQQGFTEGNIVALRAPQVEFKVPDTDDGDEEVNWPFKGMPLESADGANDELYFAFA